MNNKSLFIKIALIGALVAGGVYVYQTYYPFLWNGYGGYHMGRGIGGHGGMGFMMPLFWVLLFIAVLSLIGRNGRDSRDTAGPLPDGPDATEILKQRYAKGEIDKAEFRSKLEDIRNS